MRLPLPRGQASADVLSLLVRPVDDAEVALVQANGSVQAALAATDDVVRDDDLQLTLFCLNALHYGGLAGVSDRWEWHPELRSITAPLEAVFEQTVRDRVPVPERPTARTPDEVAGALFELVAQDTSPGLSRYVASKATREQLVELLVLRSLYVLREADPHSWAIPRLTGGPKVALVEIQNDEYGAGRPERMHSRLFADTMRGAGLDDTYGAYVDRVPAVALASLNLMTLFGLHRRLRGAIVGHLAAFEMTSSQPSRSYGNGFRRLGWGELADYFDEHIEADAVHEQIAARELAGGLVQQEPELLDEVLFGAAAALTMDSWVSAPVLLAWKQGESPLRRPLGSDALATR